MAYKTKPLILITTGDPAGIGPEIILKALLRLRNRDDFIPAVIGHSSIYNQSCYSELLSSLNIKTVTVRELGSYSFEEPLLIEPIEGIPVIRPGGGSVASGRAAGLYLDTAIEIINRGFSSALVTGPINKKYFWDAGYRYNGHTEYLKERTGCEEVYMMFAAGDLKVLLVTHHIPLKDVPKSITEESIYRILRFLYAKGPQYGIKNPRIAVSGLNPHSGEEGLIGDEEKRKIIPAVERAREFFSDIEGPLPADTLFRPEVRRKYDIILVMYHDQGLTAIKTIGPAVNVTLGIPFIRVSPDHGTAYGIAGRLEADPESFIKAIEMGIGFVKKRNK